VTAGRPVAALALACCLFLGFLALGTWQVERRSWKLDLIARVESRVHAPPVAAPMQSEWPRVNASNSEYRHVQATGSLLMELTTPVQALTALGSGYWLITPLRLADGSVILVNRGFVAAAPTSGTAQAPGTEPAPTRASPQTTTITGLLRMTEPGGGFLRKNDPSANRWYSRDVPAIAAARGLPRVAPYFIDADSSANSSSDPAAPVGGLTVIAFHNNHLLYAITWYTLALMIPAGLWLARRDER